MHFDIYMVFVAFVTSILCPWPAYLSTPLAAQATASTLEQEQFNYEIVIPRSIRSSRSVSFVPDWKARLRDGDDTPLAGGLRHRRAADAHPNSTLFYRIRGFNRTFDLALFEDEAFLSPSFAIQHFDANRTWLTHDIEHCFYKGHVNQQPSSSVSISLCHGLLGTFVYNDVEYFIEPKHDENESTWSFAHRLYTHKESIADEPQSGQCPVDGVPYFETKSRYPRYFRARSLAEKSPPPSTHHLRRRAKRQLYFDPTAKHVEVLVAYDDSIKQFHSDVDIKSYILTLFSYVSQLYSDATIGNNIKIWLVKLVDLDPLFTRHITSSDDAADILSTFCRWQKDYNDVDTYDTAVLLTRTPLCSKRVKNISDSKCDTLGLTELGTMCNDTSKCAVVRDNGFATAFTIAHEIAHLFGIRHDNDKACLEHTKEQNIMATSLTFNHNHYKWSNCSRHYFTQYLESDRYQCLNNVPDYRSPSWKDLNAEQAARQLPGQLSDLDAQCRRAFGVSFEYCKDLSHGPKCHRLYCRERHSNLSSCITNHAHWSDGTECSNPYSEIKRCFRGDCRSTHELKPINGNWGDWSHWSPCTRTCGSAVQKSQRFCDNPKPQNGGQYCSGQSTRIQSCEHNPPCKDLVDMFRLRQCSVFNNRTIDPSLPFGTRFEPKYNVLSSERCKLICKVSDDRLERSFVLSDRVEDGTPCGREEDTRDICISGVCMPIGCDLRYGSNATEDVCGICNGKNETCKLSRGEKQVSDFGISNIVDVPVNTTHVHVVQVSAGNDRYYLAVKHVNGTYVLNGIHSLQLYNVKIRIGSATLSYTGSDSGNETVTITGRLKVPLEIQVISIYQAGAPPTTVVWEYYSPFDDSDLLRQSGGQSSDYYCDRPCQGFKQVQKCFIHGREHDPMYCSGYGIPMRYDKESCNNDCLLSWNTRYQQACSTRCGDGFKRVMYECTKMNMIDRSREAMDENTCRRYVGEKPADVVPCVGDCTGTGWVYGQWGECHHDNGCIRKRSADCRNASDLSTSPHYCVADFIYNTERCAEASCDQSRWNYTSWSNCDCTSQRRRRSVTCVRQGKPVSDRECQHEPKPDETVTCYDECPASAHWETQPWQPCTATCSSQQGVRHRRVVCMHYGSVVQDAYCDQRSKPGEQEWCSTNVTCASWLMSDWSPCSVTCGKGIQRRAVICHQDSRPMDPSKCPQPMPDEQRVCNAGNSSACSTLRWSTGPWGDCSVTCGAGTQQRSVYCHDAARPSFLIPDSECLTALGDDSKPESRRSCTVQDCAHWRMSLWDKCTGRCGVAVRRRRVWCAYNDKELTNNFCAQAGEKPPTTEICPRDFYCPEWAVGMWSECSAPTCSSGMQYRQVVCQHEHEIISGMNCDEALRPAELQACHKFNSTFCSVIRPFSTLESIPSYIWAVKAFSDCSVTCGAGHRSRQVYCIDSLSKMSYGDQYCAHLPRKPVEQESCNLDPCPAWHTEAWSTCPVTCGTGTQHRVVTCKNREETVSPEKCNGLNRPATTMQCHVKPCLLGSRYNNNNPSPSAATWIPSEWGQCDRQTCQQTRAVRCIDTMTARILPPWSCVQDPSQPPSNRTCRIAACMEWRVARWNSCSVKCGRGYQFGFGLSCFTRQMPIREINTTECESAEPSLSTPVTRRECRRSCVEWRTSDWSECDAPCGTGKRVRQVTCHRKLTGQQVPERMCQLKYRNLTQPTSEETCMKQSCYQWASTQHWTRCSAVCNGGYEENIYQCVSGQQVVHDQLCGEIPRPQMRRSCNPQPCLARPLNGTRRRARRRRWDVGPWSSCNAACGVGEQYRTVRCFAVIRNRTIPDRFCQHLPQPNGVQQCFQTACKPMWATQPWSLCSAACGPGVEYRNTACHEVNNNGYLIKNNYSNQCDIYRAPTTRISCNMGGCESPYLWHVEPWSPCSSDCGRGEQTRRVYCKNRQSAQPVNELYCIPHKPVTRIDCYGFRDDV